MSPRIIPSLTTLSALVLGAAVFACGPSAAEAHRPYAPSPHSHPHRAHDVSVTLEHPSGAALASYWYEGALYVAGRWGDRYNIRVANHTPARVEAVVTVDGRDVVSGEPGNYRRQRGYVIEPYSDVVIDGYRRSLDHVAAFRFSRSEDSYSARRGTPQHVGVIGVAVFKERTQSRRRNRPVAPVTPRPYYTPYDEGAARDAEVGGPRGPTGGARKSAPSASPRESHDADDASAAQSASPTRSRRGGAGYAPPPVPRNELGTEYGETRQSAVSEVGFRRRNKRRPDWLMMVYYDSPRGLQSRGIPMHQPYPGPHDPEPEPFPGSKSGRFAPPPPRRF